MARPLRKANVPGSPGHVPQRTCAGCGRLAPKQALVRFMAGHIAGRKQVMIDPGGRAGGRGVYVCPRLECYDGAVGRRKSLQRKLGCDRLDQGLREEFTGLIKNFP